MSTSPSSAHVRRRPERTVLYQVIADHLGDFEAATEARGTHWPRFVVDELRAFLDCGIAERGLVRVYCKACKAGKVVALSCKRRGFCPSCGARRAADTAAWLVDSILPRVRWRQWVLTLPTPLRHRVANRPEAMTAIVEVFVRNVFGHLRGALPHVRTGQGASVSWIQRFGSDLRLNPHVHCVVADGLFQLQDDGRAVFHRAPTPTTTDVADVVSDARVQILERLRALGVGAPVDAEDEVEPEEDAALLMHAQHTSTAGRAAIAPEPWARIAREGEVEVQLPARARSTLEHRGPRCVHLDGFSVHADTAVGHQQEAALERLLRYAARPALSFKRVTQVKDGRVRLELKKAYRDGTHALLFEPTEFLAKLCAIVPPPRAHLVRYHGVLAPNAKWRAAIIAMDHEEPERADADEATPATKLTRSRHLDWATLLKRTFGTDVLTCTACGGAQSIVAVVFDSKACAAILAAVEPEASDRGPPPSEPVGRTCVAACTAADVDTYDQRPPGWEDAEPA